MGQTQEYVALVKDAIRVNNLNRQFALFDDPNAVYTVSGTTMAIWMDKNAPEWQDVKESIRFGRLLSIDIDVGTVVLRIQEVLAVQEVGNDGRISFNFERVNEADFPDIQSQVGLVGAEKNHIKINTAEYEEVFLSLMHI